MGSVRYRPSTQANNCWIPWGSGWPWGPRRAGQERSPEGLPVCGLSWQPGASICQQEGGEQTAGQWTQVPGSQLCDQRV